MNTPLNSFFISKMMQYKGCNDKMKIIIVEGKQDKKRLEKIIDGRDCIQIICTFGTFSVALFDEMLDRYDLDNHDVYIFVDEDKPGKQLRHQLNQELPHAKNMYIPEEHVEVEATPYHILATELVKFHMKINPLYLVKDW